LAEAGKGEGSHDIGTLKKFRVIANLPCSHLRTVDDIFAFRTYLAELHNKVHQRTRRISVTDICSFLQKISDGYIREQGSIKFALPGTQINVDILFDLQNKINMWE
jgi:hypothetical protein